ncbi:hypothetical protein RHMOL_Rhmol01G0345900 [Rhododendron molle]|uniref:Uncharacterized protein n=4 Tax=Rhododendron molle TaxID=49168 RepID=A0ACC0QAN0_RHOML|nr:hypothetical protein RHMOL_Rhmol07G0165600 [Rhododendron molle]KAI8547051.1 hypothetical protein RHMOL_Rhmol07G0165600 [Rhododendron molle]KAI8574328.1 hypothetical protein RHMOL_Rhmol01G0345900 [Rhododendron molle]KAI8574329.1 hypothetical protein RHMOL_Rhmol01G0345900 [Rhododendron molle]
MYALCADAWFQAAKRKVLDPCLDSAGADDQTDTVIVEYNDFVKIRCFFFFSILNSVGLLIKRNVK